jgi:hypothetical protein
VGDGPDRPGVISPVAGLLVAAALDIAPEQRSVPAGSDAAVDGTVRPARTRVTVVAYRVLASGRLRRVGSRTVAARAGSFRAVIALPKAGSYRLVASVPADARTAAGSSAPVDVQATP